MVNTICGASVAIGLGGQRRRSPGLVPHRGDASSPPCSTSSPPLRSTAPSRSRPSRNLLTSTPSWSELDPPCRRSICWPSPRRSSTPPAAGSVARHGPRPLDVDLLLYDEVVTADAELRLPHPLAARAALRAPTARRSRAGPSAAARRSDRERSARGASRSARGRATRSLAGSKVASRAPAVRACRRGLARASLEPPPASRRSSTRRSGAGAAAITASISRRA